MTSHDRRDLAARRGRGRARDRAAARARSTFDPVAGSFHAPSTNVTRSYTRAYETALREAVAVFDAIRMEIDPPTQCEEIDERFEREIESLELFAGAKLAGQGMRLVAHTGFEPDAPNGLTEPASLAESLETKRHRIS